MKGTFERFEMQSEQGICILKFSNVPGMSGPHNNLLPTFLANRILTRAHSDRLKQKRLSQLSLQREDF